MGRVSGKIAIITGAGSGVGEACMKIFAHEGATVVGLGRTKASLDAVQQAVTSAGGGARVIATDVSSEADVAAAVAETLDAYGRIDILVHAAGVGYSWSEKSPGSMNDIATTTPDKWREVIAINLDGCYLMCHAVLPHMLKQGSGAIVTVASIAGLLGMPVAHAYTAAKGGVVNLTRSMSTAYAKDNIRANCVAPGYIDTPMIASVVNVFDDPAVADQITPMRRPGTADEMAYGCLYLASDEASYCNGTVLVIDGGTSARQ